MSKEFDLDLNSQYPFSELLAHANNLRKGHLSGNWHYQFHGSSCKFINDLTQQLLDVKVIPAGSYRVIDCFYLFEYIKSTPQLDFVKTTINSLHDLWSVMLELEKDKIVTNIHPLPFRSFVLNHATIPADLKK